jgi:CRP/FNR family cyclic AMP-dependent transcriptional regulator
MPIRMSELANQPLLKGLNDEARQALAESMHVRRYEPGQLIALEGDPCEEVCFVGRGIVRQRHLSPDGRQHVLGYLGPGAVYSLIPALDGGAHLATTDALTRVTIYALPCERLDVYMNTLPQLAPALAKHLAVETRRLSTMVKDLALHNVRTRLARFLLDHAEMSPPRQRWTQDVIASHLGTVRDVVGRILRSFSEEGIVRQERGRVVIIDREALAREADRG